MGSLNTGSVGSLLLKVLVFLGRLPLRLFQKSVFIGNALLSFENASKFVLVRREEVRTRVFHHRGNLFGRLVLQVLFFGAKELLFFPVGGLELLWMAGSFEGPGVLALAHLAEVRKTLPRN